MTMTKTIKTKNDSDSGNDEHDDALGGRSHTSKMMTDFPNSHKQLLLFEASNERPKQHACKMTEGRSHAAQSEAGIHAGTLSLLLFGAGALGNPQIACCLSRFAGVASVRAAGVAVAGHLLLKTKKAKSGHVHPGAMARPVSRRR